MSSSLNKERITSLIEFAKQTALLRSRPVATVSQHKLFNCLEERIQGLPNIYTNVNDESAEIWLKIERIHELSPPKPDSSLLTIWIENSPDPSVTPKLKIEVEKAKLIEIGAITKDDYLGTDHEVSEKNKNQFISLDEFLDKDLLKNLLTQYLNEVWSEWSAREKERRKTIELYGELFLLWQQLQGNVNDSQIELVWGVGVALWKHPTGTITYPIITQLVEITLNEIDMSLLIRPKLASTRVEVDIYTARDNIGADKLVMAGKDFYSNKENCVNPFQPSTFEPVLKAATTFLDPNGVYWSNEVSSDSRRLPKIGDNLIVTESWVIFARPRSNSNFVQDLEELAKKLEGEHIDLPAAVVALITDPLNFTQQIELPFFRGLSQVSGTQNGTNSSSEIRELYFPLPYNSEQVQIIQQLEVNDGVVVQGPPGTGKTHSIANVICHYLATGRKVLVTSMKEPALAVLQEKIPEEIRPLTISLLTSETDGIRQFEFAINKISTEVQRIDRSMYKKEIAQIDNHIEVLHSKIAKVDNEIKQWATRNFEEISIDGNLISPSDAAREVAINQNQITWLKDQISIDIKYYPKFNNQDIIDLRAARYKLGADLVYLNKKLPQSTSFPPLNKIIQTHKDLSKIANLKKQEVTEGIPTLVDNSENTIEKLSLVLDEISKLKLIHKDLRDVQQNWIDDFKAYLQKRTESDFWSIFESLKLDIHQQYSSQRIYVSKPIETPPSIDQNSELIQAINNLKKGSLPFGISGLIGKTAQKKILESIRIVGNAPKSKDDWIYVSEYIENQIGCRKLLTRWNSLAREIPLPIVSGELDQFRSIVDSLALIDKLEILLSLQRQIENQLNTLFPSWDEINNSNQDINILLKAESYLTHYLTKERLAQTWIVKEALNNATNDCNGAITEEICYFIDRQIGNAKISEDIIQAEWSQLMSELRRVNDLTSQLAVIANVTNLIRNSGGILWAQSLCNEFQTGPVDRLLPDNWSEVWRLRRLSTYLDSIDGRHELKRLSKTRAELEHDLAKQYKDSIAKRTWLKVSENASPLVKGALEAYRSAIRKIGKGMGIRAGRYRNDARKAAEQANPAIPCWIMPHYRISESLPSTFGYFDLVIIDEASQSDLTALPAILRAKKVLIVGDDKQVSPEGIGLEEEKIRSLINHFLANQVDIFRAQMSPEKSIYDLFKVVFANSSVMLREHFRCTAPIIEYSKREFYNHELQPLRLPLASERLDPPLIDVYVEDGYRNKDHNPAEAKFIVDEICKIVTTPELKGRSIGVVSLLGTEQALKIFQMLTNELDEETISQFKITCGDAKTFQGKERDIMFLSLVATSENVTAIGSQGAAQRFNVAASRARDRMYLVRSVQLSDLSQNDSLRIGLLQHFQSPFAQDINEIANLRQFCESPFEREMFDLLTERGYRVIPQVPVGSFRIDMVVEGDNDNRLAIECDGDQYHGPAQWDDDIRRQRILERAGWKFWRCFASTFVLQKQMVITDLIDTLSSHGIEPASNSASIKTIHSEFRSVCAFSPNLPVGLIDLPINTVETNETVNISMNNIPSAVIDEFVTADAPLTRNSNEVVKVEGPFQEELPDSLNLDILNIINASSVIVLTTQQYEGGPWAARAYLAENALLTFLGHRNDKKLSYSSLDSLLIELANCGYEVANQLYEAGYEPIFSLVDDDQNIATKQIVEECLDNSYSVINIGYLECE